MSTPTLALPPAFAEAAARRTRLWEAGLRAGRHRKGEGIDGNQFSSFAGDEPVM